MTITDERAPNVHLNLNVRGLTQSATLAINDRSNQLRAEGRQVFKLGLGQSPFPVPDSVVEELKANATVKDYLPVKGLPALRDAVADYYVRRHDIVRTADDVLVGPGSKELMFLLQLVYYGDLVIPSPSWVSYAPQARIVGRQIHWIRLRGDWPLQPDALDAVCRTDPDRPRIVVLNYPNNPTGRTYSRDQLAALAEVARRYRLVVLSDEIYGELHHQGQHASIARYYPEGTIISSGLSKWAGAGGWRLGTFVFPPALRWLQDAMAVAASETFTATSAPIQCAAVQAFRGGPDIEQYLFHSRRILRALGRHIATALREVDVRVDDPEGAFYLFPNFARLRPSLHERGIDTSPALAEGLLEDTGVALLPGSDFGCVDSLLSMRIAYVDFDGARALAAAQGIPPTEELPEAFLREYCEHVTEATDRIVDWVRGL